MKRNHLLGLVFNFRYSFAVVYIYIMLYITLPFSVSVSVCVTILTPVIGEGLRLTGVWSVSPPLIRPTPLVSPQLRSTTDAAQTCYLLVQWNKLDEVTHLTFFFFFPQSWILHICISDYVAMTTCKFLPFPFFWLNEYHLFSLKSLYYMFHVVRINVH